MGTSCFTDFALAPTARRLLFTAQDYPGLLDLAFRSPCLAAKEVGKKLFFFDGKTTELTIAGEEFLTYAREIEASFNKLQHYLSDSHHDYKLNLISSPIYDEWSIKILKRIKQSYPKLVFNMNFTTTDYVALYERYSADLIISSKLITEKKYYCERIGAIHCLLVCSRENRALLDNLSRENLFAQTFITPKYHSLIHEFTLNKVPKTTQVSVLSNVQILKKAIIANLGIGYIPHFMIKKELESGELVALQNLAGDDEEMQAQLAAESLSTYIAFDNDLPVNRVMRAGLSY
ncbi:MAG: LysR substrate-binding domain-containing protein [Francisellaceae bacterium]